MSAIICTAKTSVYNEWLKQLERRLRTDLRKDAFWMKLISRLSMRFPRIGLHLGVFVQPYLRNILDGRKTIESRFSVNRCAPYGRVHEGDILLLKQTGGPICGVCQIGQVWYYKLEPDSLDSIKDEFSAALCVQDPSFWKQRESASFATLMQVVNVRPVSGIHISKRDRRGWVTISNATEEEQGSGLRRTDRKRKVHDLEARCREAQMEMGWVR